MCFVNRNPVLVLQPGKSLIAGHLIVRKHIGMNRHNQIHRTKLLLNKADDLRSCIFYTEYNNSIMHIPLLFCAILACSARRMVAF